MAKIAIVFHSGYGHTGAAAVAGASATLYPVNDLTVAHWAEVALQHVKGR